MELLIILALVAVGIFVLYKMIFKESVVNNAVPTTSSSEVNSPVVNKTGAVTDNVLDVNHDGKVDIKDAVEVVKKTRTRVKKTLDQDGDGKVTVNDAKVATKKVATKTKQVVAAKRGRKSIK